MEEQNEIVKFVKYLDHRSHIDMKPFHKLAWLQVEKRYDKFYVMCF